MTKHAAPANQTRPETGWAAISGDNPPLMYEVTFWRENLKRRDLRHIRVSITPIVRKPRKGRNR